MCIKYKYKIIQYLYKCKYFCNFRAQGYDSRLWKNVCNIIPVITKCCQNIR